MSDLNDALKDGYIGKVADALLANAAELKAKGFDPAALIKQLTDTGPQVETAMKARKAAEEALASAVAAVKKLRNDGYTAATASVSTVEGLLGKKHPLTETLRGLRASLVGNQAGDSGPAAPAPAQPGP